MGGCLYFDGDDIPEVGTPVLIEVNSVNHPTGLWKGVLEKVVVEAEDARGGNSHGSKWIRCDAKITAPGKKADNRRPSVNYTVHVWTSGCAALLSRIKGHKTEIRGLERRIKIQRETYHGLMKALVDGSKFEELRKLLDEFLKRLGR